MKKTITVHCMVKNEDRFIFFAIMSVIEYVDKLIIYDTGSTDKTVQIVKYIISSKKQYVDKITFEEKGEVDRVTLGKLRDEMVKRTTTDYFMILDGDEIWWKKSIEELVNIANNTDAYLVAQHYINCAKDIYHYRNPGRDVFAFLDKNEAATIRLYSMYIPGIHCGGVYGVEGYFDGENNEVQCGKYKIDWQKQRYFHTSFIRRSSKKNADMKVFSRVRKLFPAYDYRFGKNYQYPEVFYMDYPNFVENPLKKDFFSIRTVIYFLLDILKLRYLINIFRKNKFKK